MRDRKKDDTGVLGSANVAAECFALLQVHIKSCFEAWVMDIKALAQSLEPGKLKFSNF